MISLGSSCILTMLSRLKEQNVIFRWPRERYSCRPQADGNAFMKSPLPSLQSSHAFWDVFCDMVGCFCKGTSTLKGIDEYLSFDTNKHHHLEAQNANAHYFMSHLSHLFDQRAFKWVLAQKVTFAISSCHLSDCKEFISIALDSLNWSHESFGGLDLQHMWIRS